MNSTTGASLDDIATTLAELRQAGAHQCDPVRFHYLETLCRRSHDQSPTVAAPLTAKLQQALAAYQQQIQQQEEVLTSDSASATGSASYSGLGELLAALSVQSEAGAITSETSAAQGAAQISTRENTAPAELKSVRYFRDSWAKLGVEQRVAQSFAKAPENAGPLNSHLLVLQALGRMRDDAPAYLQHFIAYADSLLWLQQAVNSLPSKKPATESSGDGEKKRKTSRAKAR
jgi:hypothetical protein